MDILGLYGDSITFGVGVGAAAYSDRIKSKFGVDIIFQHGYSGYRLGGADKTLHADYLLNVVINDKSDLIIIMACTNDYWHDIELGDFDGDITSAAYKATTSGGLRYILNKLKTSISNDANILFCTPPPSHFFDRPDTDVNATGKSMRDYVNQLVAICQDYHVPVCNLWSEANWHPMNEAIKKYFTTDGVHLTEKGYERITSLQRQSADRIFF